MHDEAGFQGIQRADFGYFPKSRRCRGEVVAGEMKHPC